MSEIASTTLPKGHTNELSFKAEKDNDSTKLDLNDMASKSTTGTDESDGISNSKKATAINSDEFNDDGKKTRSSYYPNWGKYKVGAKLTERRHSDRIKSLMAQQQQQKDKQMVEDFEKLLESDPDDNDNSGLEDHSEYLPPSTGGLRWKCQDSSSDLGQS